MNSLRNYVAKRCFHLPSFIFRVLTFEVVASQSILLSALWSVKLGLTSSLHFFLSPPFGLSYPENLCSVEGKTELGDFDK